MKHRPALADRLVPRLVACALVLLLAACESLPGLSEGDEESLYSDRSVEALYNGAMDNLESGWYQTAADLFNEVERQHPYSAWATKAQLMAAYANYLRDAYDEAIIGLDRFIELHPGNPDVAYAYYLKALSYYEQISDVSRDQQMTRLAMESLRELITRFPDSRYARDAKLKLDLTRDHLAGKEMEIGRYYLKQGYYLAAINRFKTVVETYQTTTHVPEALLRLVEAYTALGLEDEARKAAAVLGYNFPGSSWYEAAYALLEGRGEGARKDGKPWYKFW